MPRPSSRLDLLLVPPDADAEVRCGALLQRWQDAGHVGPRGEAGDSAETLVHGGFVRARVDVPLGWTLYANQQGGFRVTCPSCGGNLVRPLGDGVARLSHGRDVEVRCPECGAASDIDALVYAPMAAVGRAALHLADVGDSELTDAALVDVHELLAGCRVVARRVSTR